MTALLDSHRTCFTLLVCDPPYTPDVLAQAFPKDGFQLIDTASDRLAAAINTVNPDAILAPNAPSVLAVFRELRDQETDEPLPLCVLFPITPAAPDASGAVDAVLGTDIAHWSAQLQPMLHLRAENARLRHLLADQAAEIEALRAANVTLSDDELEMLKTLIVNNINHELKTPLLMVKAAIDALGLAPDDQQSLAMAKGAVGRLEEVILNISELTQSRQIKPDIALVSDCIERARRWLRNSWKYKDTHAHRVVFDVPARLPMVMADKRGIGTVLQLLIDNALKFSQDEVHVGAKLEGDQVRLYVADRGIGIPRQKQRHVFSLFYQGDPSPTRRYGGAGVGLSLAKLILDRHQSNIEVESAPGKGSVFSFTLPVIGVTSD